MRRLALSSLLLLTVGFATACADHTAPTDPDIRGPDFGHARVGSGFESAGNVGAVPGTQWPPERFAFLADHGGRTDEECFLEGRCNAGSLTTRLGLLDEGPPADYALTAPFNPDEVPPLGEPDGTSSTVFGYLTTQNFVYDYDSGDDDLIRVQSSGIRTFSPFLLEDVGGQYELSFNYAILLGGSGGAQLKNDVFDVFMIVDGDQANPITVLSVARKSFNGKGFATLPGGCGTITLTGLTTSYPICTDWQLFTLDLSPYVGSSVSFILLVTEAAGGDDGNPITVALDNFQIRHLDD